jgi:hypothetical protein
MAALSCAMANGHLPDNSHRKQAWIRRHGHRTPRQSDHARSLAADGHGAPEPPAPAADAGQAAYSGGRMNDLRSPVPDLDTKLGTLSAVTSASGGMAWAVGTALTSGSHKP